MKSWSSLRILHLIGKVLHNLILKKKINIPKQQHTFEFKVLAVNTILAGEAFDLVAKELIMSGQTLRY